MPTWTRGLLALVLTPLTLSIHLWIQTAAPPPRLLEPTLFQAGLPFLPWTLWIYLAMFPFAVTVLTVIEGERFLPLLVAMLLACVLGWGLILSYPLSFEHPEIGALDSGLESWAFALLHRIDRAHVTFPSLHVAVTWIGYLALRHTYHAWRHVLLAVAIAISLATVTTRQHLLTDVGAGVVLGSACYWLALGRSSRLWPGRVIESGVDGESGTDAHHEDGSGTLPGAARHRRLESGGQ